MKKDPQVYLAHFGVDLKLVWGVVESRLKELEKVIEDELDLLL